MKFLTLEKLTYLWSQAKKIMDKKADVTHIHTTSQIKDFPTIPTRTSQLLNDNGFKTTDTTYEVVSKNAAGLVPQLPVDNAGRYFLNGRGEWLNPKLPISITLLGSITSDLYFFIGHINILGNPRNTSSSVYFEMISPNYICEYCKFSVNYGAFDANYGHYIDNTGKTILNKSPSQFASNLYENLYIIQDEVDREIGQIWVKVPRWCMYLIKITDAIQLDNDSRYTYFYHSMDDIITLRNYFEPYESLPSYATEDNILA